MVTLLAAVVSAENPAERNDRQGTGLWLVRVIVGVTRDLISLWCNNLCLPWDTLTLIPPPRDSHGRCAAGTLLVLRHVLDRMAQYGYMYDVRSILTVDLSSFRI
jgi:hypothetical protein